MRTAGLAIAMVAIGGLACDEGRPALQMDVVMRPGMVRLLAIDAARPDACNQRPFAEVGVCDRTSDAWSCSEPMPAGWLGELRVEVEGEVVGTGYFDAPIDGIVLADAVGIAGAVLVIAASDDSGDEIEIPLPATVPPQPSIDGVTEVGGNVEVTWSSTPPAASAVVSIGSNASGPRCHVAAPGPAIVPSPGSDSARVYVETFAPPAIEATAFGEARIWVGGAILRDL